MSDDEERRRRTEHALGFTLEATDLDGLGELYRGKVRDVYRTRERLVIITTDRVSAFDHVLGTIPYKGEILNSIAVDAMRATEDLLPNHLIAVPDPNVVVARTTKPYAVELVVRAYLTGSLYRDYQAGRAEAYGLSLPRGLKKDQLLRAPLFTPSTKARIGAHDEPISKQEIVSRGLMSKGDLEEAEATALLLFDRGAERSKKRGLILVDTKYELGRDSDDRLVLIDEVHTPDSSRYWVADRYIAHFEAGEPQEMLDKENLRQWLIDQHGFSGQGQPPALSPEIRSVLSLAYQSLYQRLLDRPFSPGPAEDAAARIAKNLERAGLR